MPFAVSVNESLTPIHGLDPGLNPSTVLQVQPIPVIIAKNLIEKHHYLHTLPAGTQLSLGVFLAKTLMGALTFGVGPFQAYRLVQGAGRGECLTLTRFWLDDTLPGNSESRVIGSVLRSLKKYTSLKFLVSYADPSLGHLGTIYQSTNWLYTGLSGSLTLYDFGDGVLHHSRTIGSIYGTRSAGYLKAHGAKLTLITHSGKHRYLYFLDRSWREHLRVPVLPYPKKEMINGNN